MVALSCSGQFPSGTHGKKYSTRPIASSFHPTPIEFAKPSHAINAKNIKINQALKKATAKPRTTHVFVPDSTLAMENNESGENNTMH